EMTAGETETAPAIRALHSPAHSEIVGFFRRARDDDRLQARVVFAKSNAVVIFLLPAERFHPAQDGMVRRSELRPGFPGLNRRIPMVRRAAGFVIEIAADPFRDPVV